MAENKTSHASKMMQEIVNRIDGNSSKIQGWNNAIQFIFTDADSYWVKIRDGKVEKMEKANRKHDAVVTLICPVDTLQQILDNKLGAVRALVTRKVKVDGSILAIRELRQAIGIN